MPGQLPARFAGARTIALLVGGLAVVAAAAATWYGLLRRAEPPGPRRTQPWDDLRPDPPPPDLRETFPTPFRNVKPGVGYVGDAACAECHSGIARTYHAHPMGRSAGRVGQVDAIERYGPDSRNPFSAAGFQFRIDRAGDRITHRMAAPPGETTLADYVVPVSVAIGSGTRGRTYLTVEEGAVWQSPISWFAKGSRWDLSPKHELLEGGRRPIIPACLFCHTHQVKPIPGAENRYREPLFPGQVAIGCERCHGPGQLHVAERLAGRKPQGVDHSIVNPKHLPADLRADVCRQCHLQGVDLVVRPGRDLFEYRPGLPWDQFATTFVLHGDVADPRKSVGQFEQMEASRCFAGSGGKLGCVSCHDPHEKPASAQAAAFYRRRCLSCHESKGCSVPLATRQAREDSCVACHMPRGDSSNVVHASVTEHRILRRPGAAVHLSARQTPATPFIPYPPGPHAPPAAERERDWGIAAGRVAGLVAEAGGLRRFAAEKLGAAVARRPGDAEAWRTLAGVKGAGGNQADAVAAARAAVVLSPESEASQARLCLESRQAGDPETALLAADALVKMSPTAVQHWLARAEIHISRRDWPRAESNARAALAIQPLHWKGHLYLGVCRHHRGDSAAARQERATAARLIPSDQLRAAYLRWFSEQTR